MTFLGFKFAYTSLKKFGQFGRIWSEAKERTVRQALDEPAHRLVVRGAAFAVRVALASVQAGSDCGVHEAELVLHPGSGAAAAPGAAALRDVAERGETLLTQFLHRRRHVAHAHAGGNS